ALLIGSMVGQLATVLVYIGIALFLALGLDPIVALLERRIPRAAAVTVVAVGVLLVFAGIVFAFVPVLVGQIRNLIANGPQMVEDIASSDWFRSLSAQFGSSFQDAAADVLRFLQNPGILGTIGGGIV